MSRSSTSFNGYTNGTNGQKPTGSSDGVNQDYNAKENSREGRPGGYGGFNGILAALNDREERDGPPRWGSNVDTNDPSDRHLRADRKDLNIIDNSGSGGGDVQDRKSSVGYGKGPGARQIEGQQLLRRKFWREIVPK